MHTTRPESAPAGWRAAGTTGLKPVAVFGKTCAGLAETGSCHDGDVAKSCHGFSSQAPSKSPATLAVRHRADAANSVQNLRRMAVNVSRFSGSGKCAAAVCLFL